MLLFLTKTSPHLAVMMGLLVLIMTAPKATVHASDATTTVTTTPACLSFSYLTCSKPDGRIYVQLDFVTSSSNLASLGIDDLTIRGINDNGSLGCRTGFYDAVANVVFLNDVEDCSDVNTIFGPSPLELCSDPTCSDDDDRRHRHLLTSTTLLLDDGHDNNDTVETVFNDIVKKCGHYEYEGAIHVDSNSHLYAVATLMADTQAGNDNCPLLVVTHAVFDPDTRQARKTVSVRLPSDDKDDDAAGLSNYLPKEEYLSMGTFPLSKLARAYQEADPSNHGTAVYDVITNNCATFLMNLARQLDVEINMPQVTGFVTRRLLDGGAKSLADKIRSSLHYDSFVESASSLFHRYLRHDSDCKQQYQEMNEDARLVEQLVETSAAQLVVV